MIMKPSMNMPKKLKTFILSFSLVITGSISSYSCMWDDSYYYKFLIMNPNIMNNKTWWNFFYFPDMYYGSMEQGNADEKSKTILERAAMTCPVFLSLSSEIEKKITFNWS